MISARFQGSWIRTLYPMLLSSVLLSGCATDAQKTRTQGAGAGAVLGSLIGLAVTHDARGALIGAAAGGAGGLLVGDQVARKKGQYARREDVLRGSAARAQQLAQ